MRSWGLAAWLTTMLTGAIAVLWLVAIGVSVFQVRHEIDEVFDSAMQETAQRLLPLVIRYLGQQGDEEYEDELGPEPFGPALAHKEYLVYWIRDETGRVLLHSHDADAEPAAALVQGFSFLGSDRLYTERAGRHPIFIQVKEPFAHRVAALKEAIFPLLAAFLGMIPVISLSTFLIVRRALGPLGEMRRALAARDGGNLVPIAVTAATPEVGLMIQAVNRLLGRLRTAIDNERTQAASSAHELRTPIAAARAQAQLLAESLPAGPERERADLVARLLAGLGRLAEKLLQLARAESGTLEPAEAVEIGPLVVAIVDDYRRRPELEGRLTARTDGGRGLFCRTDADALAIALQNLIDNAFLHSGPTGRVEIEVGPGTLIAVRDDGPGVPPEELPCLIQRFRRGSATQSQGTGLGLWIVDTIIKKVGGRLELRSPPTDKPGGFEAILHLPDRERRSVGRTGEGSASALG